MRLIKYTSVLVCFLMVVAAFAGCDTPEESKRDANSKDTLSQSGENISETVSEEISEEVAERLTFVIEERFAIGDVILDVEEEIYRDDEWIYKLSDSRSSFLIVVYSDGTEQGIKEALAEGNVSITDLDTADIFYLKYPIEE